MCNIAKRLLEERKRLGMNQEQIAVIGGIAKRTYCNYESGEREPMGGFFTAIAIAGVDVQYVLTGVRAVPIKMDMSLHPRQKALLDNLEHCSEEDQRAIERMALLAAKAVASRKAEATENQEELKKVG